MYSFRDSRGHICRSAEHEFGVLDMLRKIRSFVKFRFDCSCVFSNRVNVFRCLAGRFVFVGPCGVFCGSLIFLVRRSFLVSDIFGGIVKI